MSSIKLLGSLKNHRYTALNDLLPQGYAVVATFPSKSICEIKVAIRASREELESLDKYFWAASSVSDKDRSRLHYSLIENNIPTGMIDGLDRSIDSDNRLAARGATKGKQYRSPDTTNTSGAGCLVGIAASIILFIVLVQLPIEEGWWTLVSLLLSIAAGILIYRPFQSSHEAKMKEIADEQRLIDEMGPRLLEAEFYASTVSATARDLQKRISELDELGLATHDLVPNISSILSDYFDSASELEKARLTTLSTNKVLKGLTEFEIQSDPDLRRVSDDLDRAANIKIESFRRQSELERHLSDMARELEQQVRLAKAKLNAVKYRYDKDE